MLIFFFPIVISAFFQHFYTLVDAIIVGQNLGDIAFSAVGGSASKIIVLLVNFFVGVSCGITAYTARYYGQRDMKAVQQTIYNGSVLFLLMGAALSTLIFFLAPFLLSAMGTPAESVNFANTYLRTAMCGLIFCVMFNTFSGILRAIGDTRTPLYILIFCSLVNIALDILFVVWFQWHVFGVAFATLLAQAVSAVMLGCVLYRKTSGDRAAVSLSTKIMGDICKVGLPAGIQSIMYSLSNILVQGAINEFGYLTVSAWAAYVKIDNIVDVFVSSLASTVIPFVGQNLGAKKFDRARQSVRQIMRISYCVTAALTMGIILLRFPLLGLFTDNAATVDISARIMLVIIPMYLIGIPYQIFSQALRGLGKTFLPMIITLTGIVGLRVLWIAFVFRSYPTIYFLGLCYPVSSLIMSVIFSVYYTAVIKTYK